VSKAPNIGQKYGPKRGKGGYKKEAGSPCERSAAGAAAGTRLLPLRSQKHGSSLGPLAQKRSFAHFFILLAPTLFAALVQLTFKGVKPVLSVFNRQKAVFWGVIPGNKLFQRTFASEN
jgi:hypothetical protein